MSKLPPAAQIEFPSQAKQQHNSSRPNSSNETTDSQTFHRHNRHSGGCQHNQPPIEVISDHQVEVHQTSNELSSASDADEEDEADEANESLKPIVRRQQPEKQIRINKMERGISLVTDNEILVDKVRCQVEQDFNKEIDPSPESPHKIYRQLVADSIETPVYTFTLPDITRYPDDFREFLKKDLIEVSSLIQLEQNGRLNWWAETGTCQRLWPIATTGDGNCLLHAASLAMWGFHDRLLTLRKALHSLLTSGDIWPALYRRWRLQSHLYNTQFGLILDESEWQEEWKSVLKLASSEPRHPSNASSNSSSSGGNGITNYSSPSEVLPAAAQRRRSRFSIVALPSKDLDSQGESGSSSASSTASTGSSSSSSGASSMMYESLEEIHVLALAHVLRRPIIVVADTILRDMNGDALAPIPFGGIYLPLEIAAEECHKSPLLLTYNAGHFSALVTMQDHSQPDYYDSQLPAVVPVTDAEHTLLNVHFSMDPGPNFVWGRDEYDQGKMAGLLQSGEPAEHLSALASYLDLVKVSLPEWVLDQTDASHQNNHHHHANSLHHNSQKKKMQSMAKQFGSLGKKFRKNLSKITQTVGGGGSGYDRGKHRCSHDSVDHQRAFAGSLSGSKRNSDTPSLRIVSNSQNFILGAVIHNKDCAPYQHEMIDNYLVDARQRFDLDNEMKAKQKLEQMEEHEKMKRDIYLNGGYVDCVNPGCIDQGTAETSYLCKSCFHEQTVARKQQQPLSTLAKSTGNSKFYVVPPPASSSPRIREQNIRISPSSMETVDCGLIVPVYAPQQGRGFEPRSNRSSPRGSITSPVSAPLTATSAQQLLNYEQPPLSPTPSPQPQLQVQPQLQAMPVSQQQIIPLNQQHATVGHIVPVAVYNNPPAMRVKLPPRPSPTKSSSQPCKNSSCEFYGTPELDYFCSKCSKKAQMTIR